jgi:hypothetical protein
MWLSFFRRKAKKISHPPSMQFLLKEIHERKERVKKYYQENKIELSKINYQKILEKYKILLYKQEEYYMLEYIQTLLLGAEYFKEKKLLKEAKKLLKAYDDPQVAYLEEKIKFLEKKFKSLKI